MKKLLGSAIILITLSFGNTASANVNDILRCVTALGSENLDLAREKASKIITMSPILETSLPPWDGLQAKAIKCVDYAFGNGWAYDKNLKALINGSQEVNLFTATLLTEDQNAHYYRLVSDLAYLTEKAKKQLKAADERRKAEVERRNELAKAEAKAEAERITLLRLQSQLKAAIANLEKRTSCVRAKSSRTGTELDAINKRFEKSNQSLILNDTHEACTELYSNEKSEVMLNQTCIDAFQRMGHPNLVFSESEQKAVSSAELMGLLELEADLEETLLETKVKLLESDGFLTEQAFKQQLADELEAKSCAEFGYEGVYLD